VNSYLEGNIKKHFALKRTEIQNITFEIKNRAIQQLQCKCAHLLEPIHKEKSNMMQQCIKILLFLIYMKLDMFRATHRPSSGA